MSLDYLFSRKNPFGLLMALSDSGKFQTTVYFDDGEIIVSGSIFKKLYQTSVSGIALNFKFFFNFKTRGWLQQLLMCFAK
jgi:hypothetical protein